jgi:hypothetical protein
MGRTIPSFRIATVGEEENGNVIENMRDKN